MYPALRGGIKAPHQGGKTEWVPRLWLLKTSKITTDVSKEVNESPLKEKKNPNILNEGMREWWFTYYKSQVLLKTQTIMGSTS